MAMNNERRLRFNPVLNWSHIIWGIGVLGALVVAWTKIEVRDARQDAAIAAQKVSIEQLVKSVTTVSDNVDKVSTRMDASVSAMKDTQAQMATTQAAQQAIQELLVKKVLR